MSICGNKKKSFRSFILFKFAIRMQTPKRMQAHLQRKQQMQLRKRMLPEPTKPDLF